MRIVNKIPLVVSPVILHDIGDVEIVDKELSKLLFSYIGRTVVLVKISRTIAIHRNLMVLGLFDSDPSSSAIFINDLNFGLVAVISILSAKEIGMGNKNTFTIFLRVRISDKADADIRNVLTITLYCSYILRLIFLFTTIESLHFLLVRINCLDESSTYTNISFIASGFCRFFTFSDCHSNVVL